MMKHTLRHKALGLACLAVLASEHSSANTCDDVVLQYCGIQADSVISIDGLDKRTLLEALYNSARKGVPESLMDPWSAVVPVTPSGIYYSITINGYNYTNRPDIDDDLSDDDSHVDPAKKLIRNYKNRTLYTDLTGTQLDTREYNRLNGALLAEKIVCQLQQIKREAQQAKAVPNTEKDKAFQLPLSRYMQQCIETQVKDRKYRTES